MLETSEAVASSSNDRDSTCASTSVAGPAATHWIFSPVSLCVDGGTTVCFPAPARRSSRTTSRLPVSLGKPAYLRYLTADADFTRYVRCAAGSDFRPQTIVDCGKNASAR